MVRGNDGQKIFLRESDYEAFLDALSVVRKRYPFYLYAYVLMSNHYFIIGSSTVFDSAYPAIAIDWLRSAL